MSVQTMLDVVQSNFNDLKAKADDALASLKLAATFSAPTVDYSPSSLVYSDTNFLPVARVSSADEMIAAVMTLADGISTVQFVPPTAVTEFSMLDHEVWKDALSNQIKTNISDYITSMGVPSKEFQDAIFNEDIGRKQQALNDVMELAYAKVGARGFTNPNDMVTALLLDAQQKYQFDRAQVSRDIVKIVTEWARQNYQFAIDKGISFEQFHADFTYKYCTGYIDIYKTLVMTSVERFKADLDKYLQPIRAYIEAAKLPIEVDTLNTGIATKNAELDIEGKKLQIQEIIQAYDVNVKKAIADFQINIQALTEIAKETASFIQSASRSVIGIQK